MQRKSLDERLKAAPKPVVVTRLAQLTVLDHFRALEALKCSKMDAPKWIVYLKQGLKDIDGVGLQQMMCDTVMAVARSDCDQGYKMLYALIINPIYQIRKKKEAERHGDTLCAQRNGAGTAKDDYVG